MLKSLTFFRIENEDEQGPYRCSGWRPDMYYAFEDRNHPLPTEDSLLHSFWRTLACTSSYSFAYGSLTQFKAWVYDDDWRRDLHEKGFVLRELKAEGFVGNSQAVFLTRTRSDLRTINLLEVENDYNYHGI